MKRWFLWAALAGIAVFGCEKKPEQASAPQVPQPRELVLIRIGRYIEKPDTQTIDVTWWEEGEDAVVLFDGQIDLVYTIPYPWHGEDTIFYSYDGDNLWVQTRPVDTIFNPRGTINCDTWYLGRVAGFCQYRYDDMLIDTPSDIVCIGNLNMVDFDSLKCYPSVEAIGIECVGGCGCYVPVQPQNLKKIPKAIDLYIRCDVRNLDARSLKRLKKNLKGLFANVYPWAEKALPSIGKLKNLRQLDIRYFCANDRKLRHLARLKNLHTLTLYGIKISDRGLRHLAKIPSLRSLTLNSYQRHGFDGFLSWCDVFGGVYAMDYDLTLWDYLRDFLYEIGELLEIFPYAYGGMFVEPTTAKGWENFANRSVLEELVLNDAMVTDEDLRGIGQIKSLKRLSLGGCDITDDGLKYLEGLKNLQVLNIYAPYATGEGFRHLEEALPGCKIHR